jgi:hypothetical protein
MRHSFLLLTAFASAAHCSRSRRQPQSKPLHEVCAWTCPVKPRLQSEATYDLAEVVRLAEDELCKAVRAQIETVLEAASMDGSSVVPEAANAALDEMNV